MANKRLAVGALLACCGFGSEVWALDNDPSLYRLCKGYQSGSATPCGESPKPDQAAFKKLSQEYGFALSHKALAPAESLGINGFQMGMSYSVAPNQTDEKVWKRGTKGGDSPSPLMTVEIDARKGLPFSLEVGLNAGWLVNSELFYAGASLKWALNEAVSAFPIDFSVTGSFERMFGSPEMDLNIAGMELLISHNFGIGGLFQLAPYAGYSPSWVWAGSGLIDSTPGVLSISKGDASAQTDTDETSRSQGDSEKNFVFKDESFMFHRFIGGFRFIFGAFSLTPEAIISTDGRQSYQLFMGLDF